MLTGHFVILKDNKRLKFTNFDDICLLSIT